ncbi:unnamed protein product [Ceutorhynchus assimilis]|uniref:Uncharacterized protein n=1 Tax=Ceutorhynchus assimilis TaxID=467358 RepID=A0A9N9MRK5_9CUCU|nr:unnamed protein product [Ceutorhynchus assimilis]
MLKVIDARFTINPEVWRLGFVITSIEHDVNQLMIALDTVAQGRLSNAIISAAKLKETLATIEDQLPSNYAFLRAVRMMDIHNFYTKSYTYAIFFSGSIQILVEFPLTTLGRTFTLYRVNTFPYYNAKVNATIAIRPSIPLQAVSNDAMSFYEMKDHELTNCISCKMALFRGDTKPYPAYAKRKFRHSQPQLPCRRT